jgi:uncharacterized protein YndB with AHSA1/START domain
MMPVKKDASGRRSVEAQVEVPGTPEEVWRAIATGPGLSSWFVPSRIEERVGGTAALNFGPGMESISTITAWDPPRRYAVESPNDLGPGGPSIATEWTVESRSGSTCIVRVVHSWFGSTDDWDSQFEGHEQGWAAFFRILRLHLTHFRGQPSAAFQVMGVTAEPPPAAWSGVMKELGIQDLAEGQPVRSQSAALPFAGHAERVGPPEFPELLVRLDQPAPGVAHMFAMPFGGQTCISVRAFLYGDRAGATAAREESRWQTWMNERFPADASAVARAES